MKLISSMKKKAQKAVKKANLAVGKIPKQAMQKVNMLHANEILKIYTKIFEEIDATLEGRGKASNWKKFVKRGWYKPTKEERKEIALICKSIENGYLNHRTRKLVEKFKSYFEESYRKDLGIAFEHTESS